MNSRNRNDCPYKITVDVEGLMAMLSVGRNSAMDIGKKAGAVVKIGRRTLYNVQKVESYINSL